MKHLVQVRSLEVSYHRRDREPQHAVRDVSFDIGPGEVLGLIGESGCGKTTIALSLLGLLPRNCAAISGCIFFGGQDLVTLEQSALRRIRGAQISIIHQEPEIALCPVMRVGQQISEILRAHKRWSAGRCRAQTESLLARAGFSNAGEIASRYPHHLSGGQRQRILLAQAISCSPALIVADEPTASLDARSQAEFLALLRELKEQTGASMLLISHAPEVQAALADRLLVMADGQIIEQGDVRQIFAHASDPRTRRLLERNISSCLQVVSAPQAEQQQLVS